MRIGLTDLPERALLDVRPKEALMIAAVANTFRPDDRDSGVEFMVTSRRANAAQAKTDKPGAGMEELRSQTLEELRSKTNEELLGILTESLRNFEMRCKEATALRKELDRRDLKRRFMSRIGKGRS